jgi:hypothetical protein
MVPAKQCPAFVQRQPQILTDQKQCNVSGADDARVALSGFDFTNPDLIIS